MAEEKKEDKNLNPVLKDVSMKDLIDEIMARSNLGMVVADGIVSFKAGCDLFKMVGITEKAKFELMFAIKDIEKRKQAGGIIIPKQNIPGGLGGH